MEKRSTSTRVRHVQGVEETLSIEANLPEQIAILRLDTDWFETAKAGRAVAAALASGWLYVDDYYDFAGCARRCTSGPSA